MIIMYGDCDIDEKTQVLRKISEAEKCFAQISNEDIECMKNTGAINDDAYLVIKILKNKKNRGEKKCYHKLSKN